MTELRHIGGLSVSVVGVGCNNFGRRVDAAGTKSVLDAASDAGINFLDTANMYGEGLSEEFMGEALRGRRSSFVLATKVGLRMEGEKGGAEPAYVIEAFERSLRRLKTDYIDLYQLHEPDASVPIADTIGAFQKLVREGKVREIGCSNFSAEQLREAARAAGDGPRFVSVQNEYSMLHRAPEIDVLSTAAGLGVTFLPFFPLASGLLTGKLRAGDSPPSNSRLSEQRYIDRFVTSSNLETVERLRAFAESHNHSMLELAFGWLLARPVVASVIAGARTPDQVLMNARSASWQLSAADLEEIDRILGGANA